MGKDLYKKIWERNRKFIREALKKAADKPSIQLRGKEFENVGERGSGYQFNLEFKNGKVSNTKDGEAVSRDLRDVLLGSDEIKEILKSGHFKIRMDRDFCLWISRKD